ncbi:VOC family protein [Micromonospora haikouensis]
MTSVWESLTVVARDPDADRTVLADPEGNEFCVLRQRG